MFYFTSTAETVSRTKKSVRGARWAHRCMPFL